MCNSNVICVLKERPCLQYAYVSVCVCVRKKISVRDVDGTKICYGIDYLLPASD